MDYALDLHHFHEGSHAQTLVPILVATQAPAHAMRVEALPHDVLLAPLCCNANTLAPAIAALHQRQMSPAIDAQAWEASGYKSNIMVTRWAISPAVMRRPSKYYDSSYRYLREIGIWEI